MIKVFADPLLIDYIQIAAKLPMDERAQIEAYSGKPYDIDSMAVGNYNIVGPKWVIKEGADEDAFKMGLALPLAVGGFSQERPGVWHDYLLTTPEAFDKDHWFPVTRICRRAMDAMILSGQAHRLETVVPVQRLESRPELRKWYKLLGYNEEAEPRYGYCANGADAIGFYRVKH